MSSFDEFWSIYPRRKGSNPKHPASLKFATAVKNGTDPAYIASSARRYGEELREQGRFGTEFVCMASTWLNQKRWLDYPPPTGDTPPEQVTPFQYFIRRDTPEWDLWQSYLRANGRPTGSPCSPRDNGWWFPSPLPPGNEKPQNENHSPDTNVTS